MKLKKMTAIAAGFALAGAAFASDTGDALLLFKESGSFWHTATNSTITVPLDFKDGATSATLTVRGSTYLRVYEGITTNAFTFSLPSADDIEHEDVYELSLVYDTGAEMKARIGLPHGLMAGAEGATRCIPESSSTRWARTYGNGLMPVPAETTSLVVDGSPVTESTPGFTGVQGWLALGPVAKDSTVDVSMSDGSRTVERTLVGAVIGGTMIIVW